LSGIATGMWIWARKQGEAVREHKAFFVGIAIAGIYLGYRVTDYTKGLEITKLREAIEDQSRAEKGLRDNRNSMREELTTLRDERDKSALAVKKRGLVLSKQIAEFMALRNRNEPKREWIEDRVKDAASWKLYIDELQKYNAETMFMYRTRFQSRALAIVSDVTELGITVSDMDRWKVESVVNPLGIDEVAGIVGKLCEKIRE